MRPFEQMVLVLLDLPSGYIFVESQATARDYQTWQERVQQALGSIACVKYLVSDRAQALVKLAFEGLGCRSIPDLFHALHVEPANWLTPSATVEPVGQAVVPNPGNSY